MSYEYDKTKLPEIFNVSILEDIISSSSSAFTLLYSKLENHFKTLFGIEFDSNMINATVEFNLSNLEFLRENFVFPNDILCKILNILMILLHLREENDEFNMTKQSKNIYSMQGSMNNFFNSKGKKNIYEVDFSIISKNKLIEFRNALIKQGLLKKEKDINSISLDGFLLQPFEVSILLNYLNTFYFPFIRLYYHFINIEQVTENKMIEIVICEPNPVPNLNEAVKQIQEKHQFDKIIDDVDSEEASDVSAVLSVKEEGINSPVKERVIKKEFNDYESVKTKYFDRMSINYEMEQRNQMISEVTGIVEGKIDNIIGDLDKVLFIKDKLIDGKVHEVEDMIKTKKK